jgi:capsid protein
MTDPGLAGETVRVPAADIIHVIDPVEAGQLRGVSRFAPAIFKLFTLDFYDDADLERKKVAEMFTMALSPVGVSFWCNQNRSIRVLNHLNNMQYHYFMNGSDWQ